MERLVNKHEDIKIRITKARNNFKKSPKERLTSSYLEARLENLEKAWKEFTDTHSNVVGEVSSEERKNFTDFTSDLYIQIEELYFEYKAEIKEMLHKFSVKKQDRVESENRPENCQIKLPKISIPIFSGDYSAWTSFRDLFTSLIHNNKALDNVQRLHYLKGYLNDEPEQLLRHIPVTNDNYSLCWKLLEKRYNNRRFLASCILKRLLSQKNIISESAHAIKELLDTTAECLSALENIGVDVKSWDIIIIHIMCLKLDTESRKLWEVKVCEFSDNLPTLVQFKEFLETRFRSLEFLDGKPKQCNRTQHSNPKSLHVSTSFSCPYCSEAHKLFNCKKFAKDDVDARRNFVQTNSLCFNCFGVKHSAYSCYQNTRCKICKKRHHSLLHPKNVPQPVDIDLNNVQSTGRRVADATTTAQGETGNVVTCFSKIHGQVLLATALVKAISRTGTSITLRSLLDQGSQASFITEAAVQLLGLKKFSSKSQLSGLGSDQTGSLESKSIVFLKIQSLHDPNFVVDVKAHVLKKLTTFLPEKNVMVPMSIELSSLELADPSFTVPNKIDLLLGAEIYAQILQEGLIRGSTESIVAQKTKLGWIISGQIQRSEKKRCYAIVSMHAQCSDSVLLRKFWEPESEDFNRKTILTPEKQRCEDLFTATSQRESTGRYVVKLPFREDDPACRHGNSRDIADQRFQLLPSRWKTFIANRDSEISVLDSTQWSHVQSKDNPVDCASRGLKPQHYPNDLWSTGPHWLKTKKIVYNRQPTQDTRLEEKINKSCHTTIVEDFALWDRYSSLRKLVRIVAICRKFLQPRYANQPVKKGIIISAKEISEALNTCIRQCQAMHFQEDLESLAKSKKVNRKSKLTSFNPFVDLACIMRIDGRLHRSEMNEDMKHPILIPRKSQLTNLLITEAHEKTHHGGPQLMINYLRTKYWILDVKNLVKFHVRKCVTCIRYGSRVKNQLMGQLPSSRVTTSRPFLRSGVDFAGPISIRTTKGRGHRSYKGYICLFVCMATRDIHLEAVSDLTTQGFLAAFKRFVARRGHCSEIWSDNGTNFIGAAKELKSLFFSERSGISTEIIDSLANNNTTWHFIPPQSPNFGGLWEGGVKSTKHHLRRVIGNATLTYEEMATVLAQIEACLNSRPLSVIRSDPGDPIPLTPGHFLVGEPLVLAPDSNYEDCNLTNLKRWQLTQRMLQNFWRRWSQDYLVQFFHRRKWQERVSEPQLGDVVLVREDGLPPAKWLYGIITNKHEGLDKFTRVVSLKCKGNIIKRPVSTICVLPVTD